MSGHVLNYLLTPETKKTHRATWFVYGGPNGEKIRPKAGTSHTGCGWDVGCSCGWESRTGGATRGSVENELWDHRHAAQADAKAAQAGQRPVTADDLIKGTVIRIPAGTRRQPFCLEIVTRVSVSRETGAVSLTGKVLALDGSTTRKRSLYRAVTVMPHRITVVRMPAPGSGNPGTDSGRTPLNERERTAVRSHRCPRCGIPRLNRCRGEDGTLLEHPHSERTAKVPDGPTSDGRRASGAAAVLPAATALPRPSASRPSGGQAAYEAYHAPLRSHPEPIPSAPWSALPPVSLMRWHAAAEAGAYLERAKVAELVYTNADLRQQLAAVTMLLLYMAGTTRQSAPAGA